MQLIKKQLYRIERVSGSSCTEYKYVEASSFEEVLEIARELKFDIVSITKVFEFSSKKTKTITIDV